MDGWMGGRSEGSLFEECLRCRNRPGCPNGRRAHSRRSARSNRTRSRRRRRRQVLPPRACDPIKPGLRHTQHLGTGRRRRPLQGLTASGRAGLLASRCLVIGDGGLAWFGVSFPPSGTSAVVRSLTPCSLQRRCGPVSIQRGGAEVADADV